MSDRRERIHGLVLAQLDDLELLDGDTASAEPEPYRRWGGER